MPIEPLQVLQAATRPQPQPKHARLVIAGATGVLGTEVLRKLAGPHRFETTQVLAREPITEGMRGVQTLVVQGEAPGDWPVTGADTGLVMFEPPRLFHDRERALWTPTPEQLPELAAWMRKSGVSTLLIVLPHTQGHLPEALKRGFASLDEQTVAALGFERLIIIRSARKPIASTGESFLQRVATWMLSILKYMVPSSEQPVRAVKVAQFVAHALDDAPPGVHIAAPETVWRAAQGGKDDAMRQHVREWLGR